MKTHKPAPVSTLATAYAGGARWAALGNGFSQTYATRPASIPAGATLYAIGLTGTLTLPPAAGEAGHTLDAPYRTAKLNCDIHGRFQRYILWSDGGMKIAEAIMGERPVDECKRDLDAIRNALNSHAALVAALERARDHVVMSGTKCADAQEALSQIGAALALAKLST